MERIGKQEERVDERRTFGRQHRGLPSAVGVAAEKDASCGLPTHGDDGSS
jgi:hypothetical protein